MPDGLQSMHSAFNAAWESVVSDVQNLETPGSGLTGETIRGGAQPHPPRCR